MLADMDQPCGIDIRCRRKRPRAVFGPTGDREAISLKRVGNCFQVGRPTSEGAVLLRIRFALAWTVHAYESQAKIERMSCEDLCFEPTGRPAMIVNDERTVGIADLQVTK